MSCNIEKANARPETSEVKDFRPLFIRVPYVLGVLRELIDADRRVSIDARLKAFAYPTVRKFDRAISRLRSGLIK